MYERGYGLEYSGSVLLYCCAYYDNANTLISVKRIDRNKTADEAKAEANEAKPQNADFAKIFMWRTNLTPMADALDIYFTN